MTLNSVNAVTRPVTDYGTDPNNPSGGLFAEALRRLHGWLVPAVVGGDADPETQFHGYGPEIQVFTGAASRATTHVVYRSGGVADLSSGITEGPQGDVTRRIFADRLRRRSAL